jgi:O-antigen/teichoic acid export membrane protein
MLSTVANAVFFLGMTSAMPRAYYDYDGDEDRRAVFTTAFMVLGMGAVLQMVVGFLCGPWISALFLHTGRHAGVVGWAFLSGAIGFVNQYLFSYLRFARKSVVAVLFSVLALAGSIGLSVLLLKLAPGNLAAPFQATALTQALIAGLFFLRYGRQAFTLRLKRETVAFLLRFGTGTVIASFAAMLLDWSDRILIERYVSLADVGIYSAGYRLGSIVNVLMVVPFGQIWSPMMMEYRTHSNIKELFTRMLFYFLLFGTIVMVGTALFLGDMLHWLIRSVPRSGQGMVMPIIILVMFGYLVNGTGNIVSAGLFYSRKVHVFIYVSYSVAVLKIATNLLVIPRFKTLGAAWTTAGAYLLLPILTYASSKRFFAFPIDWKRIGTLAMIALPPVIFGAFFWYGFHLWIPVRVGIFLIVCMLVYKFCLNEEEKQYIIRMGRVLHLRRTV